MRSNFKFLIVFIAAISASSALAQEPFVAGTEPSKRPDYFPTITETNFGADWLSTALSGVEKPYPDSLRFLEDQGKWFTPFSKPGAPGPYDIRGWY